jgi:large subunit ribosomal protein L6
MSRIGKRVIVVPEKTEVSLSGNVLNVKGPLGESQRNFKSDIAITIADKEITLKPTRNNIATNALWGTYGSHIANMIKGVNKAFEKKLVIEGIGFKSEVKGEALVLNLGFSHPIRVEIPKGLKVVSEKNNITVSGIDKESVGQFTAKIRALKKPEPYKGKGIMYGGEVIRRKQGKKST